MIGIYRQIQIQILINLYKFEGRALRVLNMPHGSKWHKPSGESFHWCSPNPKVMNPGCQKPNTYVKLARILLHMLQGSSISRFPLTKAADCISMVTPSGHNYPKPGQDGKTLQLWRASCHKPQRISGHINSRFRSAQSNSPLAQSAKKFQPLGYILRMDESN